MNQIVDKPRYEILDGLRGVAALIVLFYHHAEVFSGSTVLNNAIGHGYLAVDFFFLLSGYVISYAYDDRWNKMSLGSFFKRRLIRLHPMIVFATIVGVVFFYFGASEMFPKIATCPWWKVLFAALCGLIMLPMPISWDPRGWNEFCPINGNAWTLYFEYFANITYALVIRRFNKFVLSGFVAASAFLTVALAMNWDVFGVLTDRTMHAYTFVGGWELSPQHLLIGFTRLLYPFFGGILLARLGGKFALRYGFWWCAIAIAAVLCVPCIAANGVVSIWNGLFEAIVVLTVFPLIVAAGAGSAVAGRSAKICKWLGEISYPLYIVQYPIVFTLFGGWKTNHPEASYGELWVVNIGTILLSIFLAWAALKLYDIPLRKYLIGKSKRF